MDNNNINKNTYNFVMLFDVENGNPNGDPGADNYPRVDPETSIGLITDVCLKRKIRNYIDTTREGESGYNILIKPDRELNAKFAEAYEAEGLEIPKKSDTDDDGAGADKKKKKKNAKVDINAAKAYMCKNYYDVRAFGAVMSTGDASCGTVRGPVQINFAKSVSPITPNEISITRMAKTTTERQNDGDTEMGRKFIVPYALYRAEGYISGHLSEKTGLTNEDIDLLWESIINMFELDHSASRGKMVLRKLIVFKHDSPLGNSPSHILFEKVNVVEKNGGAPARSINDYEITIDRDMPSGVELKEML